MTKKLGGGIDFLKKFVSLGQCRELFVKRRR